VKPVGDSVFEMRIFVGKGYRIYFCMQGSEVVLLLCGGNKSYMVRPALQGKSWSSTKERLHTYIRPSFEAEYSFWP